MTEIVHRLLGADDAAVLERVHEDVFDHAPRPGLVREFLASDANLLAVALDGDLVVGMASGLIYVHPDKPRQLFLIEVGVAAPWHRRGIARALCRLLLDEGLARGCKEAWVATEVDNAPARALYRALGGVEDEDTAVVYTFQPGVWRDQSHRTTARETPAPGAPIVWRMHLPVPPERVFEALDTDMGRAAFWAESAVERAGHVDFTFVNGQTWRGRVIERDAPRRWIVDYFGGTARFDLAADGRGGTDLTLTHEGVSPDDWNDVHAGWLNVLFPLKAWLAHGVDLRNHDADRSWDQRYADQ